MDNKSREEKVQIIRAVINEDDYMNMMTDEDIDDMIQVVQSPIRRIFDSVYKRVKKMVEAIPEEVLKELRR